VIFGNCRLVGLGNLWDYFFEIANPTTQQKNPKLQAAEALGAASPSFIGPVAAAGDVALGGTYGEAASLRIGGFFGGGRRAR
jgi:hypothetical protein